MDRQQTGNLLIGAGILAGLGTFAYWYLSGGAAAETQSGGTATKPASVQLTKRGRSILTAAQRLPVKTQLNLRSGYDRMPLWN